MGEFNFLVVLQTISAHRFLNELICDKDRICFAGLQRIE